MNLQVKVSLLVAVTAVVAGVISGGIMLYSQTRASMEQLEQMAKALAGAVQGSLEEGMLTGERRHTQGAIVRAAQEEMVSEVVLFARDRMISASSEISQIGKVSEGREVQSVLQSGATLIGTERENGHSELWVITPVVNKPECQVCHAPETKILGAVKLGLDSTPLVSQAGQQAMFLGILAGLSFLVIGGGLALTLKRMVLNPLSRLAESAHRLSQGDYVARVPENKQDEIGMLGETFNQMAQSVERRNRELEASRQELARWNIDLENKIQQRTKELEETNRIREQLLEKLISAQEEERRRIARELHDEASQSLAALVLNLEAIADALPERYREPRQKLDLLKEQANRTLGGLRNLALELRPSALDDLGLPMAINWYVKDYLAKRGLQAKVEVIGHRKLPAHTETMLFRIIQEALTNVVKHAGASQVRVQLQLNDTAATLLVEDNGKGFDAEAALSGESRRRNLGIHSMAERATLLGGAFTIRSQPGEGTCVRVEIPLVEEAIPDG